MRIKTVDGLRGLAVLFVVAFHYISDQITFKRGVDVSNFEKIIGKATSFGWCGVDLFFVMSGFLIGSILLDNRNANNFFKPFYVRRFLRIIPIYFLLLLIFLCLKYSSLYDAEAYIFEKNIPLRYYFVLIQNFKMTLLNHFGPEALTPTWSLAVEEQFYLIIPFVIYFIQPRYLKYFVVCCLICGPVSRYCFPDNFYGRYTLLISRIDSPAMGLLVALLVRETKFATYMANNFRKFQVVSLTAILILIGIYLSGKIGVLNHTVIAIIFSFVLILALYVKSGFLYKLLTFQPLIYIGGISYFIYLFHQLINGLLHLTILGQKLPVLDGLDSVLVTVLALCSTILLASISFKYLEKPIIKFSHRYKY